MVAKRTIDQQQLPRSVSRTGKVKVDRRRKVAYQSLFPISIDRRFFAAQPPAAPLEQLTNQAKVIRLFCLFFGFLSPGFRSRWILVSRKLCN